MIWKDPQIVQMLTLAAIVVLGAIVHATNQLKIARDKDEPFTQVDFLILMPTSIFSGMVFGFVANLISDNSVHLMLAVAIGSFLGLAGLNRVADTFLEVLVKRQSNNKKD